MLFFAHLLRLTLPFEVILLLGLTVWIIYTLDHLMDVKKANHQPNSPRHYFHFQNKKSLQIVLVIIFLIVISLLISLSTLHFLLIPGVVLAAIITCCLSLVYFFGKKIAYMKEFLIAAFYVLGITLAPLAFDENSVPKPFYGLAFLYFIIAWVNLLILSYLDKDSDEKDGFDSVIKWVAPKKLKKMIFGLAIFGVAFSFYLFISLMSYFHIYTAILLLMQLIHMIYFLDEKKPKEITRKILEASFLLPFIVLLF
ncbi:UbiA family prenyltransferase [Belliella baltica]|nr:UbiA family prenyltransferase [Belliella baltica]